MHSRTLALPKKTLKMSQPKIYKKAPLQFKQTQNRQHSWGRASLFFVKSRTEKTLNVLKVTTIFTKLSRVSTGTIDFHYSSHLYKEFHQNKSSFIKTTHEKANSAFVPRKYTRNSSYQKLKTIPSLLIPVKSCGIDSRICRHLHNPLNSSQGKITSNFKSLVYSLLNMLNFYLGTTRKHVMHSKKAAIIIAFINFQSSLSTDAVYLTSSQHDTLKNSLKRSSTEFETTQYSNSLFFRQGARVLFLPKNHNTPNKLTSHAKIPNITPLNYLLNVLVTSTKVNTIFRGWYARTIKRKKLYNRSRSIFAKGALNRNITNRDTQSTQRDVFWYKKKQFTWKLKKKQQNLKYNISRIRGMQKNFMFRLWDTNTEQHGRVNHKPSNSLPMAVQHADAPLRGLLYRANSYWLHSQVSQNCFGASFTNVNFLLLTLSNPFLLKLVNSTSIYNPTRLLNNLSQFDRLLTSRLLISTHPSNLNINSNIQPHSSFKYVLTKQLSSLFSMNKIREDIIPFYYHTLVRFLENCSGKKILFQFYPFAHQNISPDFIVRYKSWIPRMGSYERRLGHKFFFEEALHIMHLSFVLHDAVLFSNWLKSMILRISFWKTRSIFRFIRYLYLLYFTPTFNELGMKGLKIKLKGKISAAGNSRKRTILYRTGETSHSKVSLKVSYHKQTINTFTGVMGFQVWIFY